MSHIIKNEKDIKNILEIINVLRNEKLSIELIKHTLDTVILKDDKNQKLTNYTIFKNKFVNYASFNYNYNNINVSINGINKYIDKYTNLLSELDIDKKKIYPYLFIYMIAHEVEHSIQYLIGNNKFKGDILTINNIYSELFKILTKDHKIITNPITNIKKVTSKILYDINSSKYLFERNADLEAYDLLYKITLYEGNNEFNELFYKLKDIYIKIGYNYIYNGSIEETFKRIMAYNKVKKYLNMDYNMSLESKLRYGFPIEEKEKKILIK